MTGPSGRPGPGLERRGYLCLAGATACYGTLWPATRFVVQEVAPLWYGGVRLGIAAALLAAGLAVAGRLRRPPRADLPIVATVGVLMAGAYSVLFQIALRYVEAGRGAVVGYTTALFVAPAAALLFGERLRGRRLLGWLAALFGLAALFNPVDFDWADRAALLGNGLLLAAAASWSVAILHLRVHRQTAPTLELVPWQMGIAAGICLIGALAAGEPFPARISTGVAVVFAYGTFIGTVAGMWLMLLAFRYLPAVVSSVGVLAAPVIALIISVGVMGEPLTWSLATGVALIIGGIALVAARPAGDAA